MPIFCFLIAEGLHKTSNPARYLQRLLIFALISELPFDLAFNGGLFYWQSQNVFWTFFITAGSIYLYEHPEALLGFLRIGLKPGTYQYQYAAEPVRLFILPAGALLTAAFFTDYAVTGFLMIALLYFTYHLDKRLRLLLYAGLMSLFGFTEFFSALYQGRLSANNVLWTLLWFVAVLSCLMIGLYNGKRGKGLKWFFYVFYPTHLLILSLVNIYFIKIR